MIALAVEARGIRRGDRVMTETGWRAVEEAIFGDMYASDGIYFTRQSEGTYDWGPADVQLHPTDLVVVLR